MGLFAAVPHVHPEPLDGPQLQFQAVFLPNNLVKCILVFKFWAQRGPATDGKREQVLRIEEVRLGLLILPAILIENVG